MDRKTYNFFDYKTRIDNLDNNTEVMPQICFDTNVCNPPAQQNTSDVLTMAFVNVQPLDYVYDEAMAFKNGTLFPNINKPFYYGGNFK